MNYYTVGTPIGRLNERNEHYFVRGEELLNINPQAFQIWVRFLHGSGFHAVASAYMMKNNNNADAFSALFKSLLDTTLLVPENDLLNHFPLRQGYGVGMSGKEERCTVFLNQAISISYPAFIVWTLCSGSLNGLQLIEKLSSQMKVSFTKENMLAALKELLRNNLVVFVD